LNGNERAAIVKEAVLRTRPGKEHHDAGCLRERWLAEAAALGFEPATVTEAARTAAVVEVSRQASRQPADQDPAVINGAVRAAAASRAVFSRADVAGHVAALLPVDGRPAAAMVALVEQLTDRGLGLTQRSRWGSSPPAARRGLRMPGGPGRASWPPRPGSCPWRNGVAVAVTGESWPHR
jgi:hypothetical protein